ncbi:MAG: primosomal protein N' [Acholeplasmataceae bacterium]|nr:primosomal protein N' [Acholeplasmataceae bacterium]
MKFANIAINLPVKSLFKQFTYRLGDEFDFVDKGWRVIVPFGHQMVEGFVVSTSEAESGGEELKDVIDTLGLEPWFDNQMLETAKWISKYYLCSLAEAMRLFVPGGGSIKSTPKYQAVAGALAEDASPAEKLLYVYLQKNGAASRKEIAKEFGGISVLRALTAKKTVIAEFEIGRKFKEKLCSFYLLTEAGKAALAGLGKAPAQKKALEALAQSGEIPADKLELHGITPLTARTLCRKGFAQKIQKRVLRDSYSGHFRKKEDLTLTQEQESSLKEISLALNEAEYSAFLLQGVTGSGKTEIYLRASDEAVRKGLQVMVLVPEIALTGQIVERFKAWFGEGVVVAHSKLSQSERADVWHKTRRGMADILIGVRSAVFAPFARLGLIIIDEEQEYSYKQEERPCYHARTVALKRARLASVPVVLGSAPPDVCTYHFAQKKIYRHLRLTTRPNDGDLAEVKIVDMRRELQGGNRSVLSECLKQELLAVAECGEQAIVLLNRRGFSTFVMCRDCGEAVTCPHCAVSLVYHDAGKALRCHYCGYGSKVPDECPKCHSRKIKYFGTGTQKAEAAITELGQGLKVLRMDQDSTSRKFGHEDILRQFVSGSHNVLLGTQMVAKGHDINNVTLVGILAADSQLNLPDFRAGERTFNLLTQAAGRAGRGSKRGRVILQAYDADNDIIKLAAAQDYDSFAAAELSFRKELEYPPFMRLLKITVSEREFDKANRLAIAIATQLHHLSASRQDAEIRVHGPFPAIIEKVRDFYRINILVKSNRMEVVKSFLTASEFMEMKNVYFDIDPVSVV